MRACRYISVYAKPSQGLVSPCEYPGAVLAEPRPRRGSGRGVGAEGLGHLLRAGLWQQLRVASGRPGAAPYGAEGSRESEELRFDVELAR